MVFYERPLNPWTLDFQGIRTVYVVMFLVYVHLGVRVGNDPNDRRCKLVDLYNLCSKDLKNNLQIIGVK